MTRYFSLLASIVALCFALTATACKKDQGEAAGEAAEKAVEKTEEAAEEKKEAQEEPGDTDEKKEAQEAAVENKEAHQEAAATAVSTGIAECDELIQAYVKCDKLPQQSRDAFLQSAEQWKKSIEAGGDAAKEAIVNSCKQSMESTKQALSAVGC